MSRLRDIKLSEGCSGCVATYAGWVFYLLRCSLAGAVLSLFCAGCGGGYDLERYDISFLEMHASDDAVTEVKLSVVNKVKTGPR